MCFCSFWCANQPVGLQSKICKTLFMALTENEKESFGKGTRWRGGTVYTNLTFQNIRTATKRYFV